MSTSGITMNLTQSSALILSPIKSSTQKSPAPVNYTDTIKKSGNINIDALLAGGDAWWHSAGADGSIPSAVARHSITYSFMSSAAGLNAEDATGFQPLTSDQQDTIKSALSYIASLADLTFTEVASGGDIQYGSNTQASSAAYARYPNQGSQVMLANNQSTFAGSWAPGSYEWETILHETGHALGLKHPGKYNAGGGTTPGPYLSSSADNRSNTIMSYNNPANTKRIVYSNGFFTSSTLNPDTYQTDDIAALQYLYGSSQTTTAKTYQWSAGQVFSETIWDPNSDSVIDLSNQTRDNVLDLRGGHFSSIAERDAYSDMPYDKASYARMTSGGKKLTSLLGVPTYTGQNNLAVAAGSHIDNAIGGSGNDSFITNNDGDTIDGGDGNDAFFVTGGNATLVGGNGDDSVYVEKSSGKAWALSPDNSTLTETRTDKKTHVVTTLATLSLSGIEHVKFWNGKSMKAVGVALLGSPPADVAKTVNVVA